MREISAIAAVDSRGGIGFQNGLPWPRIRADMQHFREKTLGSSVVMGRRTWESLKPGLLGRVNYVLSRSSSQSETAVWLTGDAEKSLLDLRESSDDSIFVIGGAEIFYATRHLIDRWIVTRLDGVWPADTFLDLDSLLRDHVLTETQDFVDAHTEITGKFQTYRRRHDD